MNTFPQAPNFLRPLPQVRAVNPKGECASSCYVKVKPGKVFVPMATQTTQVDGIPAPIKTAGAKPKKSAAPRFVTTLQGKVAEEGERVVLEAIVDGVPECKISWLHNTRAVKPGPDVRIAFDEKRTTLTIVKVRQIQPN